MFLLRFIEIAKEYGGIFSLKIGSNTLIILSDRRIIKEVLDKSSSVSSNRPNLSVAHTITGGDHLLFMDSGTEWRLFRRLLHQEFMSSRCDNLHIQTQNAEAVQMLRDFIIYPDQYMLHAKRFSNSIIMSLREWDYPINVLSIFKLTLHCPYVQSSGCERQPLIRHTCKSSTD
jgi:cytochrome P450